MLLQVALHRGPCYNAQVLVCANNKNGGAELDRPQEMNEETTTNGQWKVGDKAVYPSHGVGEITAIEANELFGPKATVYVLELLHTSRRILIPTTKAEQVGLRAVISAAEADRVMATLSEPPPPAKPMPWTKRQRALLDKLSSGSLSDVAEVLRELFHLKCVKDLSFGQRRLFDTAISLLVQEVAIAKDKEAELIEEEIRAIFG